MTVVYSARIHAIKFGNSWVNCTKTATSIEMPFGEQTRADSRHYLLGDRAHCPHQANTVERSQCGVNGWTAAKNVKRIETQLSGVDRIVLALMRHVICSW